MLVRVPGDEDLERSTSLDRAQPLLLAEPEETIPDTAKVARWQEKASAGDHYPFGGLTLTEDNLRFKQKSGGLISKRSAAAKSSLLEEKAEDPAKGTDVLPDKGDPAAERREEGEPDSNQRRWPRCFSRERETFFVCVRKMDWNFRQARLRKPTRSRRSLASPACRCPDSFLLAFVRTRMHSQRQHRDGANKAKTRC